MKTAIQKLQAKRQNWLKEAQFLTAKADKENRELTAAESKRFDVCMAHAERLGKEIARREKLSAATAKQTAVAPRPQANLSTRINNGGVSNWTLPAGVSRIASLKSFKGDQADLKAYRFGQFMLAVAYGNSKARQYCLNHGIQLLAQATNINEKGGILVPPEFAETIIDLREKYGVFRQECRKVPMGRDTLTVPRRTGGLTAYFVSENPGSGITESDKTFDGVQLVAKKMATLTRYSSEIAEDAIINVGDDLASEIAYAFASKEDDCGFNGTGASTYGGITGVTVKINDGTHTASVLDAASGNVSFETLDLEDFQKCVGRLPEYVENPKWYISKYGWANAMQRLAYAAGGNDAQTVAAGMQPTFLGYPVVISQKLNRTAGSDVSAIKVLFGDLSMAATLGDRREIVVMESDQRYFEYDQIGIRGTQRIDINVHDLGDTSEAGPIVALKTAAS